ncbi:hypothetical protein MA20_32100 [Bradyrhizobium japonicum]|uniref:Uncharacterized protein n=1 Tax=Bradyrhizobium japonicum TaxID=375 RepID=A0A0A3XN46_BRAJP|nr:hypothetical protein [Bradyrhizobium japonicum]KGT75832.1 hypothetical protein MA20_32100 [Bradyrhizobium japonicum]
MIAASPAMSGVTPISPTESEWRDEQDLDVIKREIRRAKWVYLRTDFDERIPVSKKIALQLIDKTRRAVEAGVCTSASGYISVFVGASDRRHYKTDPLLPVRK